MAYKRELYRVLFEDEEIEELTHQELTEIVIMSGA